MDNLISINNKKIWILSLGLSLSILFTACARATPPPPPNTPSPVPTTQPTSTLIPTSTPEPTLTPLPEIELNIELPEGDPEKGYLTAIRYGCQGCHAKDDQPEWAPRYIAYDDVPNIFERGEMRIASLEYQGRASTNYEYIIESILLPQAYFVPGDWPKEMSTFNINIITEQEIADIIAWMETLE